MGWVWSFLNSKDLPVYLSRTGIAAKSGSSGVHHRSISSLGYLRWKYWSGLIVRVSSMFRERVRCATGSFGDVVGFSVLAVWQDRVRATTGWGFGSTRSFTLGIVGGSTLGGGACTIGDGGFTLGDVCCILGDRRSSHFSL